MNRIEQHPVQAIGLMLAGVFMFSTMDASFKLLVEHYGSFQVAFFRCLISALLFAAWILARDPALFRSAYLPGHVLRAVIGVVMLFSVGECFREMQLADAYAIFFAAPLIITLLSGPLLGEAAGIHRIAACFAGFAGVLVVLKPGGATLLSYGSAMGLVAMLSYSFVALLLRKMGEKDGTVTIAFWFVAIVGVVSGTLAIPGWRPLDSGHWPILLVLGLSGTAGQLMITAAFRRASAAIVAPFDYTHMLWALVYGLLIWGHLPGVRTWVGAAIVVASGLYILYRERRIMTRRSGSTHG